jgi:hypothetical protein
MEPIKKLFQAKVFYEFGKKKSELDSLQNQFLKNIPNEIQPNVKVNNIIKDTLIVEVTSNTIAHKIKMISPSILKKINKEDISLKLKKIKIKISVQNPIPKRKINKISISSINQMKKLSNDINNSPLKTYLKQVFKNNND